MHGTCPIRCRRALRLPGRRQEKPDTSAGVRLRPLPTSASAATLYGDLESDTPRPGRCQVKRIPLPGFSRDAIAVFAVLWMLPGYNRKALRRYTAARWLVQRESVIKQGLSPPSQAGVSGNRTGLLGNPPLPSSGEQRKRAGLEWLGTAMLRHASELLWVR